MGIEPDDTQFMSSLRDFGVLLCNPLFRWLKPPAILSIPSGDERLQGTDFQSVSRVEARKAPENRKCEGKKQRNPAGRGAQMALSTAKPHSRPATSRKNEKMKKIFFCGRYLPRRLDALIGFNFAFASEAVFCTWVARLQLPFFHFMEGSGNAAQNQPPSCCSLRLQPLQASMISAQDPPLKEQPFAVMNVHFLPFRVVSHTNMFNTPLDYIKIRHRIRSIGHTVPF